jgi:hypothetical protein
MGKLAGFIFRTKIPVARKSLILVAGRELNGTISRLARGLYQLPDAAVGTNQGFFCGGEGGIRTLEGLLTLTPLAGARLRPLGHLSGFRPHGLSRSAG